MHSSSLFLGLVLKVLVLLLIFSFQTQHLKLSGLLAFFLYQPKRQNCLICYSGFLSAVMI